MAFLQTTMVGRAHPEPVNACGLDGSVSTATLRQPARMKQEAKIKRNVSIYLYLAKQNIMYWTQLKSALLYGQPAIAYDSLQPQVVEMAVREISRLVNFGWVDELTEDICKRIRTTCQKAECSEIWDEFQVKNKPYLQRKAAKKSRKKQPKNKRMAATV